VFCKLFEGCKIRKGGIERTYSSHGGFQKCYALWERELQETESSTQIIVQCSMEDTSWGSRGRGKILTSICIRCDVADGIDLAEAA